MLTMTGIGLVAGLTVGAGPAMAAPGASQASTQSGASASKSQASYERNVGVYGSWTECQWDGQLGEQFGQWDEYDCEPIGGGAFVLEVSYDSWGSWNNWDNDRWHNFRDHHRGDRFRDHDRGRGNDRRHHHRRHRDND
jgi:hypothetical protein